jgi:hypothetical protein
MEDHGGSCLCVFQCGIVGFYIQISFRVVVVLETFTWETEGAEDLVVIGPGWLGDVNLGQ